MVEYSVQSDLSPQLDADAHVFLNLFQILMAILSLISNVSIDSNKEFVVTLLILTPTPGIFQRYS